MLCQQLQYLGGPFIVPVITGIIKYAAQGGKVACLLHVFIRGPVFQRILIKSINLPLDRFCSTYSRVWRLMTLRKEGIRSYCYYFLSR